MRFQKFVPLTKMEEQPDGTLHVYGLVTAEQPDLDKEVCDYAGTKPFYQAKAASMFKLTSAVDGMIPSIMPMREMHQLKAVGAGRTIDFDDTAKAIRMGFHVVDPVTVLKFRTGVLVGFSQGGDYVGELTPDPSFPGCKRYVADPAEVSAVDSPCLPQALVETMKGRFVSLAKGGGVTEEVPLVVLDVDQARLVKMERELAGLRELLKEKNTKRVDGEDLTASCFAHVGDPEDPETWKLPIKFSDEEKTKCLIGSTPVPLLNGRTVPITDIKEGDWVYSFDLDRRTVAPGRVIAQQLSGSQIPIVRVHLDNGTSVECTPNHPFLLLTAQYRMAAELQPGDSIMPLYLKEYVQWKGRKKNPKIEKQHYEQVFQPWYGTWEPTHRLVHREANNVPLFPGNVIHHQDHNHRNNEPSNLAQMTKSDHMAEHAADCDWWGGKSRQKEASAARWARAGASERQSKTMELENDRRKHLGIRYAVKNLPNILEIHRRYFIGHESMKSLGAEFGISPHTINRRFKEENLPLLAVPCHIRQIDDLHEIAQRVKSGESMRALAREIGMSSAGLRYKLKGELEPLNHKVVCVEDAGLADVYDLQIDKYENFAIGQGVFVHNTHIRNALARFEQTEGMSAEEKKAAKRKILAAAKEHGIEVSDADKAAIGRLCAKLTFEKGLYQVSQLGDLLENLHWLCLQTEWERDFEDDGSKVPDNLREAWLALLQEFKVMAIEEADELAAEAGNRKGGNKVAKISDQAGLTKAAKTVHDHLEKLVELHKAHGEHMKKAHDAMQAKHEALGEHIDKCMKAAKDAMDGNEPAAAGGDGEKALELKIDSLEKNLATLTAKLATTPAPGGPVSGAGPVVSKSAFSEFAELEVGGVTHQ